MANENSARAVKTFEALCGFLDKDEWNYKKDVENLAIYTGARGDDLPMEFTVRVNSERNDILLISFLPVDVSEDKRVELAIAVAAVNYKLINGAFDYDIRSGKIIFKMSNSFIDSDISEELFGYMVLVSCRTIDDYNDKFLMLAKGLIDLRGFLAAIQDDE